MNQNYTLTEADSVNRMQKALRKVKNIDNASARKAAYIRADISDEEQALFDADAINTEKKRRELFKGN